MVIRIDKFHNDGHDAKKVAEVAGTAVGVEVDEKDPSIVHLYTDGGSLNGCVGLVTISYDTLIAVAALAVRQKRIKFG